MYIVCWCQVQITRVTPSPTPPPPLPPKQPGGRRGDILEDEDDEEEELEAVPVKASFGLCLSQVCNGFPLVIRNENFCRSFYRAGHSDIGGDERQRTRRKERIPGRNAREAH